MTYRQIYNETRRRLREGGVEPADFEGRELMERFFGLNRQQLAVRGQEECRERQALEALHTALSQRIEGRPLQYILGSWEFAGLSFAVGEGVLIPREDTMALYCLARERAEGQKAPVILDLCAGTGALGVALCRHVPGSRVYCCEKSRQALPILRQNIEKLAPQVTAVECDILTKQSLSLVPKASLIVSNPPYIPTGDLDGLQKEVRREPRLALDGGRDGLRFYRALTHMWKEKLVPGGALLVEIGMGQQEAVSALFAREGFCQIGQARDGNGVVRVIYGTVPVLRRA